MYPTGNRLLGFEQLNTAVDFDAELELSVVKAIKQLDNNIDEFEINTLLKALKKIDMQSINQFIELSMEFYFTHPKVLESIQDGRQTLFPNARTLPEIDFDLLIPVFEQGE